MTGNLRSNSRCEERDFKASVIGYEVTTVFFSAQLFEFLYYPKWYLKKKKEFFIYFISKYSYGCNSGRLDELEDQLMFKDT